MAKEPTGSSGIRRNASSRLNPPSQSRAKPDSKVRRPAPAEDAAEAAPPPAPRRTGESKVRRPAPVAPPSEDGAGDDAPPSSDSRIRRQRDQEEDPSFIYKKIAVLSVPVLVLILAGLMLRNYLAEKAAIDNATKKREQGPTKIVKRDFMKEIETAQFMFDQAFELRKDAMLKLANDPEARAATLNKGIETLVAAHKICTDALKEVGSDTRGYEYILDMKDQIETARSQFQAMRDEKTGTEPEKAPGTTTQDPDESKKGENKNPEEGGKAEEGKPEEGKKDEPGPSEGKEEGK